MGALSRGRRRIGRMLRIAAALGLLYLAAPAAPDRTLRPEPGREIWLVDHGFHVGLLLPQALFAGTPLAGRVGAAAGRRAEAGWVEIGWGDEAFYRRAAESAAMPYDLVAPALLWPTPSVLHVARFDRPPEAVFRPERLLRLPADRAALAALRAATLEALAAPSTRLSAGLYGAESAFLRARGGYSALYVCNHWLSAALRRAGYPSTWLWSTLPQTLFAELRWRGAAVMRR